MLYFGGRECSSVVEHSSDKGKVGGSIPPTRTRSRKFKNIASVKFFIAITVSFVLFWPSEGLAADPFYGASYASEQIRIRYQTGQVRILLVPGHSQFKGGAEFGELKERELNVIVGHELAGFLKKDPKLNVLVTREIDGAYAGWLSSYMITFRTAIENFQRSAIEASRRLGLDQKVQRVYHPTASPGNAFELYAINKFANDNKIDLVIHLHLNDYAGRRPDQIGKFSGFAVYAPARRLVNSAASFDLAQKISDRLSGLSGFSDLPGEAAGVVPDEELIALGSNASRDGPSVLIEYGYLYEPQFRDASVRPAFLRELAFQTQLAILDYLGAPTPDQKTTSLVLGWSRELKKGGSGADDLSLQFFLKKT